MKAAAVVGFKVDPEALLCLSAIAISVQIHLLVLDRAPFCVATQNGAVITYSTRIFTSIYFASAT